MTEDYKVTVKRSTRKTASIYIERDGSLSVFVPENLNEEQINDLLKANEYKIYKYQAKRKLLNENAVTREPVNGQSYLYLGRNYYLQYSNEVEKIESNADRIVGLLEDIDIDSVDLQHAARYI